MEFKSDAHRRWFFANLASGALGGGGGESQSVRDGLAADSAADARHEAERGMSSEQMNAEKETRKEYDWRSMNQ